MSLAAELVDEVRIRKGATDSGSPAIDQLAFAELLTSGEYEHVARVRRIYRGRRDRRIRALSAGLLGLDVQGAAAGMHVLLRLGDKMDEVAIAETAASRGCHGDAALVGSQ
jgi:GntR family transcriptional regulator / MocR family aminotransferase